MIYIIIAIATYLIGMLVGFLIGREAPKCKHRFDLVLEESNLKHYRKVKVYMCRDCGKKKVIKANR